MTRAPYALRTRMVQVLIILALFASRTQEVLGIASGASLDAPPWWGAMLPFITLAVMWLAFHAFTRHAGATIDRTGCLAPLNRAHALMDTVRVAVLVVLFACVLWPTIAWADRVRAVLGDLILVDELVIASPVLLMLVLTWWSVEPLERRVHDALVMRHLTTGVTMHPPQTRGQWVFTQVRHQALLVLVPVCMLLGWTEVVEALPRWFSIPERAWWLELAHWLGVAIVLCLTPLVLRFVWSTVRMGEGELREQVLAVCRAYRVRVVGPLVWRTHGSLINAAILGVFYPFRYLLLSDALLERLPREQLEVVIAHEVAHVRRRHMLWTGVGVFGAVMGVALAIAVAWQIARLPGALEPLASGGAAIASIAVGFTVFGLISRRFEWDADAFAAAHIARLTSPSPATARINEASVAATLATLQSVADLNGIPAGKFTLRHGSISERQRRVAAMIGVPVDRMPIMRQVLWIKVASIVLFALALGVLALGLLLERLTP